MKRILPLLLTLLSLGAAATDDIRFTHLTVRDGLSSNLINHITSDSRGFIWISTNHGLCRYDGYTFKNFLKDSNNPASLPFYSVEEVQEDADGKLWISFGSQRYVCYDPSKEIFLEAGTILADRYGINESPAFIYIDSKKGMWVETTAKQFVHYDRKSGKCFVIPASNNPGTTLTDIGEDHDGVIRLYSDGYFDHVDRESNEIDARNKYIVGKSMRSVDSYNVYCDHSGDYWIFSTQEAWLYRPREDRWTGLTSEDSPLTLSGNRIRDIVTDRNGRIWIAIDNGGINIVDKAYLTVEYVKNDITDERSLGQNSVTCLYADSDGGVWAGTFKRGVSYYNKSLFKFNTDHFTEFRNVKDFSPDISSITEDSEGNMYMAVPDGLIKVDRKTKHKQLIKLPDIVGGEQKPEDVIISMVTDREGTIWMGTYTQGLLSYDGKSFRHHILDEKNANSLANKVIWSIAEDASGYLWIGTWGHGLYGLDPKTGRATAYREEFKNDQIVSICISKDNNLYMGTTYGILIYDPMNRKFEKLTGTRRQKHFFSNNQISQVYEDSRGLLWIATREGLNIYDRRNDEIISPVSSINQTTIHGIVEDNDKNMWVTTSQGLFHIVVNSDPTTQSFSFSHRKYEDLSVLDSSDFNPRAIMKHSSGTIVTGGVNGISLIDPSNIKYDTSTPHIHFTSVQLFNRDIKIDSVYDGCRIMSMAPGYVDAIRFKHNQNVFSVTFSAMNYVLPEKTKYMYMLEGFDIDWDVSGSNKLTYTNLAPGSYTLKIKAVNNDGYASDEMAELKIIVEPPFYRSWVAYVIYAILLICIVLLVRAYMRHIEKQKYKLMKIRQEARHKHEIDDMKLRFFTNISHDLRTPLTLILTPLEYVIGKIDNPELKDKLVMARNNAMRLLAMVNQLLDFRKSDMAGHTLNTTQGDIVDAIRTICNNFTEYSEHRNINLTFYSQAKSLFMMFDEDKINKIVMNLLSNAFKFTPEGGRVDVSLDVIPPSGDGQEMLEIKVADNGCGISDEHKKLIFDRFYQVPQSNGRQSTGSGVGLNLVKEFVTLHNGSVSVCDNVGKGSVFIVAIPVVKGEASVAAEDEVSQGKAAVDINPERETVEEEERTSVENRDDKRPVVLIVDDNDDFRSFMKDCLKNDYVVHEARDGAEAWSVIPELQPDIIISDVMMPEMDGNELCRLVKNDIRTSHILVILLTARAAKEHELKGFESGADDYITKPFNLDIFTYRIKNLLQHRRDSHKQPMEIAPSKINITPLDQKLMQKAIRYVEDNLSRSELSVEELSGELGMSRVHLYKKMVSITGKTPIEFIRIIRLKRAAQLLTESQMSIAEVTYQTGFNNLTLFRKYFKNEFGILPSEYQAKHGRKYNESI